MAAPRLRAKVEQPIPRHSSRRPARAADGGVIDEARANILYFSLIGLAVASQLLLLFLVVWVF